MHRALSGVATCHAPAQTLAIRAAPRKQARRAVVGQFEVRDYLDWIWNVVAA